jgi:hypothetical protein
MQEVVYANKVVIIKSNNVHKMLFVTIYKFKTTPKLQHNRPISVITVYTSEL